MERRSLVKMSTVYIYLGVLFVPIVGMFKSIYGIMIHAMLIARCKSYYGR